MSSSLLPAAAAQQELIVFSSLGSEILLPLPVGGACKIRLTLVLCMSSLLPGSQPIADLVVLNEQPDCLAQLLQQVLPQSGVQQMFLSKISSRSLMDRDWSALNLTIMLLISSAAIATSF